MSRAPNQPYFSEEFPIAYEPRPIDLTWLFWEFGDCALDVLANSQELATGLSKKYQLLQSADHPLLSAIYKRFRETWVEMHLALWCVNLERPNQDALRRALQARRKARTLMSCLWPYVHSEMNRLRVARGLPRSRLGRGRFSRGLQTAIDAWELELREPGTWTRTQLAARFCIYENHKHGPDCIERFKTNRSSLRRKLRECGVTFFDLAPTPLLPHSPKT